jgi:HSP20 family protein
MLSLMDDMDRLFRDLVRTPWSLFPGTEYEWGPAVDVYETDDEVVVKASVPGVEKENLEVNVTDEALTLHGETKSEQEVKEEGYYRREIRSGTFHRVIPWPTSVDTDSVKAKMENGILEVRAAKTEKAKGGKKIEVK